MASSCASCVPVRLKSRLYKWCHYLFIFFQRCCEDLSSLANLPKCQRTFRHSGQFLEVLGVPSRSPCRYDSHILQVQVFTWHWINLLTNIDVWSVTCILAGLHGHLDEKKYIFERVTVLNREFILHSLLCDTRFARVFCLNIENASEVSILYSVLAYPFYLRLANGVVAS